MATVDIVDLRVRAIIGTHPWERRNKQELIINISLQYDASKAGRSDKLKDALDYEEVAKAVIKTVEASKCFLLERLASKIKDRLKAYPALEKASLCIQKPQALADARTIAYRVSF